jgi:hypothetical protein
MPGVARRTAVGWWRRLGALMPVLLFVTPSSPEPLQVELVGCDEVRAGALCELDGSDAHTLTVVPQLRDGESLFALVDGEAAPVPRAPGTERSTLDVPAGARSVRLFTLGEGRLARVDVGLGPLRTEGPLRRAQAALAAGEVETAYHGAEEVARGGSPDEAARARGVMARAARRGAPSAKDPGELFREAIAADRAAGLVRSALRDHFALSHWLRERNRLEDARRVLGEAQALLDELGGDAALYAEAKAQLPYYQASTAYDRGDLVTALAAAERVSTRSHAARADLGRGGRGHAPPGAHAVPGSLRRSAQHRPTPGSKPSYTGRLRALRAHHEPRLVRPGGRGAGGRCAPGSRARPLPGRPRADRAGV